MASYILHVTHRTLYIAAKKDFHQLLFHFIWGGLKQWNFQLNTLENLKTRLETKVLSLDLKKI